MPKQTTVNKSKTNGQSKIAVKKKESETSFFDFLRFGESYTSLFLGIIVVIISTVLLLSFVHNRNVTSKSNVQSQNVMSQNDKDAQKIAKATQIMTATPTVTPVKPTVTIVNVKATATPAPKKIAQNQPSNKNNTKAKVYTVTASGETLWEIAEKTYGSGYNWVDIARANNLSNPDIVHKGNKLTLPQVESKLAKVNKGTNIVSENTTKGGVQKQATVQDTGAKKAKITGESYKVAKGDNLWDISVRAYGDGYQWIKIARVNNLSNPDLIYSGNSLKIPRG